MEPLRLGVEIATRGPSASAAAMLLSVAGEGAAGASAGWAIGLTLPSSTLCVCGKAVGNSFSESIDQPKITNALSTSASIMLRLLPNAVVPS